NTLVPRASRAPFMPARVVVRLNSSNTAEPAPAVFSFCVIVRSFDLSFAAIPCGGLTVAPAPLLPACRLRLPGFVAPGFPLPRSVFSLMAGGLACRRLRLQNALGIQHQKQAPFELVHSEDEAALRGRNASRHRLMALRVDFQHVSDLVHQQA